MGAGVRNASEHAPTLGKGKPKRLRGANLYKASLAQTSPALRNPSGAIGLDGGNDD